jgi:hypothetical protein
MERTLVMQQNLCNKFFATISLRFDVATQRRSGWRIVV